MPARERCYYRSIFAVEWTLRREQRTETRGRGSEIENERCRGSCICGKTTRFASEREMAVTGRGAGE